MVSGKNIRNKNIDGVKIVLDKERYLKFDLNAFVELEDKFGDIDKAFEQLQKGSIKSIRSLLWAGLIHEEEELTEKEAGRIVGFNDIEKVSEAIMTAVTDAMPEVTGNEEIEEKN
ncbi:MAG: hypothetical protein N4A63_08090 [Vallitalea sp.]|jgi:hypothetical protein|nr:hypothetical protein [Vallitalea sp.]